MVAAGALGPGSSMKISGGAGSNSMGSNRRTNIIAYFLQSGSPRVLNCLRTSERIAAAKDGVERKLLFKTPILNKIVIFKDLQQVYKGYGTGKEFEVGTKVYLPFNGNKLSEGGQTFFFDRREFMKMMGSVVDTSDPERRRALEADAHVLELIDTLPTFAPFLLRDLFERSQVECDSLYCDIPESEWQEIRAFIRERFRQILSAVTGESASETRNALDRLLDKLWDLTDIPALEGLAAAFGLPTTHCVERFHAWKGTLYFCWIFETLQRAILEMGSWLNEWPRLVTAYPPMFRSAAKSRFQTLQTDLFRHLRNVELILSEYERAFNDLFVHGSGPQRFIKFLSEAQAHFTECGTGIGMLQHAHEVWDRLTEAFPNRQANFEVLDEMIYAVNSVLARPT
jgi:hypothetical protein